jgi:hypothetical protein
VSWILYFTLIILSAGTVAGCYWLMIFDVNRKLPAAEQFTALYRSPSYEKRLLAAHKRLYPNSLVRFVFWSAAMSTIVAVLSALVINPK